MDLTGQGRAHKNRAYGRKTGVSKIGIGAAAGISETGVEVTAGRAAGIGGTAVRHYQWSTHGSHPWMEVFIAEYGRAAICIHDQEHRGPCRRLSTNSRSLSFGDGPGAAVPSARATRSGLLAACP
jgi:hypothetical protein